MIWKSVRASSSFGSPTLVHMLHERVSEQPERTAYTCLGEGATQAEASSESWTRQELFLRAQAIAAWLQEHVEPGARALMLYPSGLDFIAAFFGCLEAGVIAVPAYPPDPMRIERSVPRLAAIAADADTRVVLTTRALIGQTKELTARFPQLARAMWVATDALTPGSAAPSRINVTPDTLAFFQYTSGSTGTPKGVMVSHDNLVQNLRCFRDMLDLEGSQFVSWLPLFHDMGLIQGVLLALYVGSDCTLMSPGTFIRSPIRWLQALSGTSRAMSAAPNFAYKLCLRKVSPREREELDLSGWDIALNAAEPVRAETIERFAEYFSPSGFRRSAFWPGYGLAEATLMVSGGGRLAGPKIVHLDSSRLEQGEVKEVSDPSASGVVSYVGCGQIIPGHELAIVDTGSLSALPDGRVGEIWSRGPSVALGYWKRERETRETFEATLSNGPSGRWLRTGDLGFVLNGELFVSSRLKDLIIVRGRNHYPQDIELTAEQSHPALRPGGGATFSIEHGGEERIVIVQEAEPKRLAEPEEVFAAIVEAISVNHELYPQAIVLIRPGSLPKTSSGKIQRSGTRAAFLSQTLDVLAQWSRDASDWAEEVPSSKAMRRGSERLRIMAAAPSRRRLLLSMFLMGQISSVLRLSSTLIDPEKSLGSLGFDSLTALELKNRLELALEMQLPMVDFLRSPTIAALTESILGPLVDGTVGTATRIIASDAAPVSFPLSHGQNALWFLQQVAPESAAYNVVLPVRIVSEVSIPCLRRALSCVVQRHPALLVSFAEHESMVQQTVHEGVEIPWDEQDGRGWTEEQAQDWLTHHAWRPFNLSKEPLLRAAIASRPGGEHLLVLVVHHSIIDFWSIGLVIRELGAHYSTLVRGGEPFVERSGLHFSDYVQWQRAMLEGPDGERLERYWLSELGGELPTLDLPTDKPRPPVQTYDGASIPFRVGPSQLKALRGLVAAEGVTLYTLLLSAFQVLLGRYSGQRDILVGSPSAGRSTAELADVVGYFVNTLVLRGDLSQNPMFSEFLQQMRGKVLGAIEHDGLPFALLVKRLLSGRDPSRSPIFQAMFSIEKDSALGDDDPLTPFALRESGARIRLGDLVLESTPIEHRVAQFDLTMMVAEVSDELVGSLEYNTALFERETIEVMVQHYLQLLRSIVESPSTPIWQLPLSPQDELTRSLIACNQTALAVPSCLAHQMFEASADAFSERIAVESGAQQLTYGQLESQANRLAAHLRSLGVGHEDIVGVCLDKTVELAVALLATLKAGAAYVPLDGDFPSERLAYMTEDAKISVLITSSTLADRLCLSAPKTLLLDAAAELLASYPATRPQPIATPSSLAYVLYTSGSTGRPKGVMIEHRALVNFITSMAQEPGLSSRDALLSITTPSFDIFGLEFYLPLAVGAKVIFASKAVSRDGSLLSDYLARSGVSVLQGTPSALQLLVDAGGPLRGSLKVLCGGEALPASLADALLPRVGSLFNMYGPTETTIWSSVARVSGGERVSLGQPIANTQFYVLDEQQRPVPLGLRGELYIGGAGLARGYLGRPELTAERFVVVSLPGVGEVRLYRTGDWVRRKASGEIVYLGRADQQIKLRGFRIELGEIESVVRAHSDVAEAAVIVTKDASGGHLAAFVTAKPGASLHPSSLREYAAQSLPEYMVPGVWTVLPVLPHTPNQKIDRNALARISSAAGSEDAYVPPANPLEALVLEHWQQALGAPRLTVHQNFFDAGGHSMLAALVMTKLGRVLGMPLPLHTIFSAPTAAAMARVIESLQQNEAPGSHASSDSLEAQVRLDASLVAPSAGVDPGCLEHLLLTGATGFLGAHLLKTLAAETSAMIHCLVRGDTRMGRERLVENLRAYGLYEPALEDRLIVWSGDLTAPLAGLSEREFDALSERLDAIYHNGALVDFVRPFRLLKAANVLGTVEMLRLAARGRPKALHLISTLSAFPSLKPGEERTVFEDDPLLLGSGDRIHGDYAESKWVADRIVMLAQQRGFAATIFRPGIVYGHAETGIGRVDDFVHTFIKGCVELGKWPWLDTWVNLTPVDFVVQATVKLSLQRRSLGKAFHLTNPLALPVEALADVLRDFGYSLKTVPYQAWRAEIARTVDSATPNALVALLPYLTEDSGELFRQPIFDASQVLAGLAGSGLTCPPAESTLLFRWFEHLVSIGFLPHPERQQTE